jgi:hypothetical protein
LKLAQGITLKRIVEAKTMIPRSSLVCERDGTIQAIFAAEHSVSMEYLVEKRKEDLS